MSVERFSLRKLCDKDADRMLEWMHDDDVTQYLRVNGKAATKESVLGFISDAKNMGTSYHYAIVDEGDTYCGTISLKNVDYVKSEAEYAVALHSAFIGRQVAVTATRLVLNLAFTELGLSRVYLNVLDDNKRAIKFYEKFGFEYLKSEAVDFDGISKTLRWYYISDDIFRNMCENLRSQDAP